MALPTRIDQPGPSSPAARVPSAAPRASRAAPRRAAAWCVVWHIHTSLVCSGMQRSVIRMHTHTQMCLCLCLCVHGACVVKRYVYVTPIDMLRPPAQRARAVGKPLQVDDGQSAVCEHSTHLVRGRGGEYGSTEPPNRPHPQHTCTCR